MVFSSLDAGPGVARIFTLRERGGRVSVVLSAIGVRIAAHAVTSTTIVLHLAGETAFLDVIIVEQRPIRSRREQLAPRVEPLLKVGAVGVGYPLRREEIDLA